MTNTRQVTFVGKDLGFNSVRIELFASNVPDDALDDMLCAGNVDSTAPSFGPHFFLYIEEPGGFGLWYHTSELSLVSPGHVLYGQAHYTHTLSNGDMLGVGILEGERIVMCGEVIYS